MKRSGTGGLLESLLVEKKVGGFIFLPEFKGQSETTIPPQFDLATIVSVLIVGIFPIIISRNGFCFLWMEWSYLFALHCRTTYCFSSVSTEDYSTSGLQDLMFILRSLIFHSHDFRIPSIMICLCVVVFACVKYRSLVQSSSSVCNDADFIKSGRYSRQ